MYVYYHCDETVFLITALYEKELREQMKTKGFWFSTTLQNMSTADMWDNERQRFRFTEVLKKGESRSLKNELGYNAKNRVFFVKFLKEKDRRRCIDPPEGIVPVDFFMGYLDEEMSVVSESEV